jgi:hypothetical protein
MPSPFVELLADLGDVLNDLGIGWYVFGAQAALLYGAARLTADVDVTVELGHAREHDLIGMLLARGFELRLEDSEFLRATRVLPMTHRKTGLAVDIVLGGPGLEELFLSRAQRHDMGGIEVPVAAAEDIIVMKVLSGRPKDSEDILSILRAQSGVLDLEHVRAMLSLVEDALGQSGFLPAFEALASRADRQGLYEH